MAFNRPPRIQKALPGEVVKIPKPRGVPSKPGAQNWLNILLPVGAVLISVVLMIVISGSGGGALSYLIFLPIMLATYVATAMATKGQARKYKTKIQEVKQNYQAELKRTTEKLKRLKADQEKISREQNPETVRCIQRAKNQDVELGERRPTDSDFLTVRLGSGEDDSSFKIEGFEEDLDIEELKPELETAKNLPTQFGVVQNVPKTISFLDNGSIGFAGNHEQVNEIVKAFFCQILTHHWPTEVQVAVANRSKDWHWIEDTPHFAQNLSTLSTRDFLNSLEAILHNREQLFESRKAIQKEKEEIATLLPVLIILFESSDSGIQHPAIKFLLDKGKKLGVFGVFVTPTPKEIPSKCGAILQVAGNVLTAKLTGREGITFMAFPDKISQADAHQFAKYLKQIEWPDDLSTNPPDLVTLLELLGSSKIEDLPVREWWEATPNKEYLRAPIGLMSPTSPFIFDINDADNAYGPHGVLGGMTGSGKSEVLRTILLSLAAKHHPYDVNFALIDYKGGGAFAELDRLPHTVGVITNIESHSSYAERIILALTGEIETRERILGEAHQAFKLSRPHIDDYRQLRVRKPLPRLIIVFDEFAEFKQKHLEESKRLISIARKGRSLGIHLILATQNIQSAIDPEILQNSSFRICLKVGDAQDSMQMVGIPDAVNLPRGRAIFLSKNRVQFQVAFSGVEYSSNGVREKGKEYVRVWPDGHKDIVRTSADQISGFNPSSPTQASMLVEKIIQTANQMNLEPAPKVWPDPLPTKIYLEELIENRFVGGWDGKKWQRAKLWGTDEQQNGVMAPVLGTYDVPARQKQYVYQLNQQQGGDHLLVFGSATTGRSTLLRSLVISAARLNTPEMVNFYILDYGGQSALSSLKSLPHVGAVATRIEKEKTERIIQYLHSEVTRRNNLLADAKANTWVAYNKSASEKIPIIYLLIDNFREFKAAFQSYSDDFVSSLDSLISGSSATGIFLVVTCNTSSDLGSTKLADNIGQKISLYQVDQNEYSNIIGRPGKSKLDEEINLGAIPGRGYLRGTPPLEFQVALPIGPTENGQTASIEQLGEKMNAWSGARPKEIEKLPLLIPLSLSKKESRSESLWAPLGKEYSTLETRGFSLVDDGPLFWIASQSNRQGKTTTIKTWILGLAKLYRPKELKITFIDFHGSREYADMAEMPHKFEYVAVERQLEDTLARLFEQKQNRQIQIDKLYEENPKADTSDLRSSWPHFLIVIDDFGKFIKSPDKSNAEKIDKLSQNAKDVGFSFVIGSKLSEFPTSVYDNAMGPPVRGQGSGILLGGSDGLDQFNQTSKPKGQPNVSGLPPGRGFMINRNQAQLMHAFAYWEEGQDPDKALQKWLKEISGEKQKV